MDLGCQLPIHQKATTMHLMISPKGFIIGSFAFSVTYGGGRRCRWCAGGGSSIPAEKILVKNGTSGLRRLLLVQTNLVSSASSSNQPSFPRQLARPIHQLEDAYLMHCKGAQNMANLPAFNWSHSEYSQQTLTFIFGPFFGLVIHLLITHTEKNCLKLMWFLNTLV